ncbi:Rpp14 family protein [Acanthamoeba castellanii str. Neff]|uniref:Ribonuclease P/MRP protein subunit POP5 n=1 Tax=Acanthamoeba castellanii (strain ATCC 30010 / Neff) TaxID=1257118 RepID=L8H3K9_ACACF|nr:Rpp14 family protein [Acanthamoeba castellanii str. Neff]ELR19795.1 Rpp14 family protein [Acanthamoeba castellanii str. Neff]
MVRFKNRYLLVELVWGDGMVDSSISAETLKREVKHQIQLNFGDFGVGLIQATLQVKYWNHLTNLCIIRCARDYYKMVWAAVTMINTLNQRSVLFRLVHLGGTVTWPPPAGPDGTSRPLF